ncbi:MAG TPA: phenylalanine--tRNA ligase subunit beta [Candidatus Veblenbacteria bacterium]|nr:phenylalanine--tRNA ligase subunit beta [Candidatus Veblenbacteria bacterium]
MKISYNILKNFIEPPKEYSAKEIANTLTMHTVEVEEVVDLAERLKGTVVGLVTKVKDHPKADKLKLATIDIGKKSLEVVCGGVNLREGMKVAFAQVGTQVRWHGEADWAPLEKATIRGVASEGMACAAEELDIPDEAAVEHGIMNLTQLEAEPGTPLAEALGLQDIIIEVDNKSITHRPDLWGHFGIARELAAIWQVPLKNPENVSIQSQQDIKLQVKINEPKYCRRYLGIVLTGLRVASSPVWLQQRLSSLGMRPINNIVDVTNYVMLEYGQPLHAFDLSKLASPEIIVRLAKRNEKLVTIDGVEHKLESDNLIIADIKQAVALAGIMGGEASEVSANTESIVLESATFDAINIRQTAGKQSLRTEASVRFEKSLDPGLAELAIRRAVELMSQIIPGVKMASELVDDYPESAEPINLMLNIPWLQARLGCDISSSEIINILERLGFSVSGSSPDVSVTVPSWRATRDITRVEDLIEEVARIYGYNKIPITLPKFAIAPPDKDAEQDLRWLIREVLVGAGWTETLSTSFVGSVSGEELELVNPVDKARAFLRPSLLASMVEQFEYIRRSAGNRPVKLFELGRVFINDSGQYPIKAKSKEMLPNQPWHLILASFEPTGNSFRVVKGMIEFVEAKAGVKLNPTYKELAGGFIAEIDLDGLSLSAVYQYKALQKYPGVERDLSIILPPDVSWEQVTTEVRKQSPLIVKIEVFDVYPEKGSLAFSLTFQEPSRTLKSEEVNDIMAEVVKTLQDKFKAIVR